MSALAAAVGGRTQRFVADLRNTATACDFIAPAEASFGPIDILINNAGVQVIDAAERHVPEEIEAMIALNLTVPLLLARRLLPAMKARGGGTLVDISSVAGLAPTPGMWVYNASKAGLGAASESLRGELRGSGVHVLTVYPGPVDTPMARAGYVAYPENQTISVLPEGDADELARRIVAAVELKQGRIVYPDFYHLTRWFPGITRWFLDRFTPAPRPRDQRPR